MHHRRHHSLLLAVLTCWLTLAGSGDDFNILRTVLAVPGSPATTGNLPLDDPNTDFVQSTTGNQVTQPLEHACWADASPMAACPLSPCLVLSPNGVPSPLLRATGAKPPTPLRC